MVITAQVNVSIIICTYKRQEYLLDCIRSISAQTVLPREVIVVDDDRISEAARTAQAMLLKGKQIEYHYFKKEAHSKGLTRSRNIGIELAKGDIVLFLDDDVEIEPDYISQIVILFRSDTSGKLGGVGGYDNIATQHIKKRFGIMKWFFLDSQEKGIVLKSGVAVHFKQLRVIQSVQFLLGYNMAYRREVLDEFKFEELWGVNCDREDVEFSYRVSKKYDLFMTPHARLIHKQAPQAMFREISTKTMYMWIMNRFYMFWKHFYCSNRGFLFIYLWSLIGWFLSYWSQQKIKHLNKHAFKIIKIQLIASLDIIKIIFHIQSFKAVYNKLEQRT